MGDVKFDIGDEVECTFYGGNARNWVVYGYIYYEEEIFYICLNDTGVQKDICHQFLRKKTCVK